MTSMNKDYRTTKLSKFEDIISGKENLEKTLKSKYPQTKIMYNRVSDKNKNFKEFAEIYNYKCAYCGISTYILNIQLFEVDHFICESSFEQTIHGRSQAGKLSNLVLACHACNRGKSDFLIEGPHRGLLNPDDTSIANIFFRDADYYIRIHQNYSSDDTVKTFYDKLGLGSEFRRLDYLLMELRDLLEEYPQIARLNECYRHLFEARNHYL